LREIDKGVVFQRTKVISGLLLLSFGFVLWCLAASCCAGQSASANGVLSGLVLDPSGARVAYAPVYVSGAGVNRNVETDATGHFSVPSLPAGVYDLSVQAPGFRSWEKRVTIARGETVELQVKLQIATPDEVLDVTPDGRTSTSAADNKSALIFGQEELAELSDDNATLQQQLLAMGGGDPSHPADIYVDGFNGGRFPPKSSIRQVRINQNPFSAQYPSYGTNRFEIFTKPGTDTLHGGFITLGNNSPWNTNNPYVGAEPPYFMYDLDGHLSGRIDKKTSFFAGGNFHDMQNNDVVNAIDPQTLMPIREAISNPDKTEVYSGRLDRAITKSNTLTGRYETYFDSVKNAGVGLLVLPAEASNMTTESQTLQLGDTQILSPKIVSETRFEYIRTRMLQKALDSSPTVIVEGTFNGGGSSVGKQHDNQDRYEWQEYLSFDRAKHFIRAGAQYDLLRDANESTANYNGTFIYPNLGAYQANSPTQFSITEGDPSAVISTGWLGAYGEDEWKVAKSLTLNGGLRFESQSSIHDHADWAPRVGFAWSPGARNKKAAPWVIRSGFGLFYDRFQPGNILTAVRQNGVSQKSYFVADPALCPTDPLMLCPGQLAAVSPTPYSVSPRLHVEYDEDASFSAERIFGRIGSATVTYLWSRDPHQYISENINAPLPGTYNSAVPNSGVRPLGGTENIYQFESEGIGKGQMVLANANLRPTKRLMMWAFYVFQDARNDTSGAGSFPSNSYNLGADYGRSGLTARQRLFAGGNLGMPWKTNLNLFLAAGAGQPFNITTGTDLNGDSIYNDRPSFATDLSRASVVKTAFGNFDTDPIAGQRIIPVNYGNSPGYYALELSAGKNIPFGPRPAAPARAAGKAAAPTAKPDAPYNLRFSVEAQNVVNHVNPGTPVGVLNSPLFGSSLSLNTVFTSNSAANRVVVLSTSFDF
jgi:hypothetical protein